MGDTPKFYKGLVTHVIDPSSFWMQIGTDNGFDLYRVYQASIEEYFNTNGDDLIVAASALSQGDCVVVKKRDHKQFRWKRARVSRVEGESVDVFYVDDGYAEIVKSSRVRSINGPFFEYLSPQAIRVALAGIQPLTRSWTSRAISVFEERVLHKSLIVSVLEIDESQSLFVALYRRGDGGDWYSVTHSMLEEDLGLPNVYSHGLEKSFSHDVVDRALLLMNQMEFAETSEDKEASSNDCERSDDEKDQAKQQICEDENNEPVQKARHEDNKQAIQEVWDGGKIKPVQEVWDEKENQGVEEIWDDEENQTVLEVWDDAIEELEGSSSEDETVGIKEDENESNSATNFIESQFSAGHLSEQEKGHVMPLLTPADFMAGAGAGISAQIPMNSVGVLQFNIGPLSQTRALSANEMQVKVEQRTQKRTVKALQKDLHRCKEDLDEGLVPATNILWGRSDSQVGQPHFADDNDLQESISEEINNRFLGDLDEMKALRQSLSKKSHELKKEVISTPEIVAAADVVEPIAAPISKTGLRDTHTLTEEESYRLQVEIIEILKNKKNETPEMLRVQVHGIVPAEKTMSRDHLASVVSCILEAITRHKWFDPDVTLTILETYTVADAFLGVLVDTLKSMKDKFVKIPKFKQKSNHEEFAGLLAMLFIQSQCWSSSICNAIQMYSLGTVEKWTIFNKKRKQDQEAAINTELLYLDCVHVFMRQTQAILIDQFHKHIESWLDEIQEKLLQDHTQRCVRARCLSILLDNNKFPHTFHHSLVSVGTQTGQSSGRGTPNRLQSTSQAPLYKAPRGTLYSRNDPYVPHVFPSEEPEKHDKFLLSSSEGDDLETSVPGRDVRILEPQAAADPAINSAIADVDAVAQKFEDALHCHSQDGSVGDQRKSGDFVKTMKSDGSQTTEGVKDSNEMPEGVKPSEPPVKRIRYTPETLKSMNPLNGMSRSSNDIKEPFELKHIFCRMDDETQTLKVENSSEPSRVACQRYSSVSPKEGPSLPGSNAEVRNTLRNYLSRPLENTADQRHLNNPCPATMNTSFKGRDLNCSPTTAKISSPEGNHQSIKGLSFEKEDCVHDVTQNVPSVDDCIHDATITADNNLIHTYKQLVNTGREYSARKAEWSDIFKNTNQNCYAADATREREKDQPKSSSGGGKKKKKTKYRPLDDFLEDDRTFGVDESGTGFDELEEFSKENLQMYIELEKEGEERQLAEARLVHGPRPITSTNSKSRESLFADARKPKPAFASQPWVPKKRKCTRCGSENHIINDCTEGTINDVDDMSYLF